MYKQIQRKRKESDGTSYTLRKLQIEEKITPHDPMGGGA